MAEAFICGANVFCMIDTGICVSQLLDIWCAITVYWPGTFAVKVGEPVKAYEGPTKLGGNTVNVTPAPIGLVTTDVILILVKLVVPQPIVNCDGLAMDTVGKLAEEIIVTVLHALHPFMLSIKQQVIVPGASKLYIETVPLLTVGPPENGVQEKVQLVIVFDVVAVNVAGEPTGHVIFCAVGLTVNEGITVFIPILKTEKVLHPVAGSVAVTVYCAGLQNVAFVPDAVPLKLTQV